jgi:hypothetical protein
VQCKILTADRLLARNWPCNPVCVLCDQELESATHLCLQCVFARQVWYLVSSWTGGRIQIPPLNLSIEHWWNSALHGLPKEQKRIVAAILIYTAWHIWKERNRRIFEGAVASPSRVLALIKENLKLRPDACGGPGVNLVL